MCILTPEPLPHCEFPPYALPPKVRRTPTLCVLQFVTIIERKVDNLKSYVHLVGRWTLFIVYEAGWS